MSNLMADFLTNFNAIFRGNTTIVPAAQAAGAAVPNVEINKSISASTSASNAQAEALLAELRTAKESRDKQAAIEETQLGQNGVDDVDDVELERSSSIPRLTELLPYTAYIASQKIFVLEAHNAKGVESPEALGFAFELQPLSGMSDEVISIFSSIVETAPTGSCMQLSLMGSNDLSLYTKQYIEMREPGMFRTLAARRMEHFEHSSVNAPFSSEPYLLRQFRLVLSATMPCKNPEEPVKIEQVVRWRDQIASVLKSIHMYSSDWDADDLVQFASLLCNPQQMFMPGSAVKPQYDPGLRVRALIVKPSTAVIPSDDGQQLGFSDEHNSCVVRSFSVRNYPLEYSAFDTSSLIGDFNQTSRAFSCPFLITVGWRKNDFEARKNVVQIKAARATQQIESPLARFMPEIADKKRDWDILQESFTNGAGDVQLFHQVTLFCTANSIIEAEENAKAVWRSRGFELTNDVYLGMQSFLVVLPMGLTPAMASDLRAMDRLSTKTVDNVIHTAPICVDWAGVGKPVIALAGRRGQVGGVDIFDGTQTNYNAAVAGASGSGKSVFCNELLINYQGTGARCWVIDVGGSYEKLCQRLGGQIIRFGSETQLSLNPFPMVKNLDEDMEVLQPLVAQMAAGTRGDVSALQNAAIGKAIRLVWQERGPEMTITDLRDVFKAGKLEADDRYDKEIADLATLLDKYAQDGAYARFFTGPPTIRFTNDFVLLELEELKSKKDLQSVVLLIIMYQITNEMYQGNRTRQKVVLIDEAWDLMAGGSAAAEFIEVGYRRARKYNGAFITATQGIADYYKTAAATAALDNSNWIFMLNQKSESLDALESSGRFTMTAALKRVLASVKSVPGQYSEVFVKSGTGMGVMRLLLDPYSLLLYSSKPEDTGALLEYTQTGMGLDHAIEQVLKDRGLARAARVTVSVPSIEAQV